MLEREKIQNGTRLRLLRQRDGGVLACTGMIPGKRIGTASSSRKLHLEHFELVSASADCPIIERIRSAKCSPLQLVLPFTEVALYRGTEAVGTFEMSID